MDGARRRLRFHLAERIFLIAKISETFISDELITETSIVGGVLIAAAGLGVMDIKDCKTINLLPALLMPIIFLFIRNLFV